MLNRKLFFEITPDELHNILSVNTVAPFYLLQLCAKNMLENTIKGNIVNISSIAGISTFSRGLAYATSKAAVNKFTQNSALELAKHGIRVNTVAPGVIEAGMNAETKSNNPELWQEYQQKIPLSRTGIPEDVAEAVLFLASDSANWVTGKVLEVDGGHVL